MIFDVIIIGAGPAGSTAAKYLSEQGINTLLLDKECFPKDKPCAGGLCSHIEQFEYLTKYFQINSDLIQSICRGSITYIPHHKRAYTYHADNIIFYNIYRKDFDSLLVNIAKKSGAEFLCNAHVKSVKQYPHHVEIRLLDKKKFQAKYCIIADGSRGRIGNYLRCQLGLEKSGNIKWVYL